MIVIREDELMEWHAYVKNQRDRYKEALEVIQMGSCPTVPGMASDYRKMKREELMAIASRALQPGGGDEA